VELEDSGGKKEEIIEQRLRKKWDPNSMCPLPEVLLLISGQLL
jgi:hypothetical protein